MLVPTLMTHTVPPPYIVPSWSTGTNAEILNALQKHYLGEINLADYWSIGDERIIHLSAIDAIGVNESHVEQDIIMVLMHIGGKELVSPIGDKTECAFIIGQKDILKNGNNSEIGYINPTNTIEGGWNNCSRRAWCNELYRKAFPKDLLGIFKKFKNITSGGHENNIVISEDFFALPAEKEVLGTNQWANSIVENELTQFEYYKTTSNRIKDNESWWSRSPKSDSYNYNCLINADGDSDVMQPQYSINIVPFGCI